MRRIGFIALVAAALLAGCASIPRETAAAQEPQAPAQNGQRAATTKAATQQGSTQPATTEPAVTATAGTEEETTGTEPSHSSLLSAEALDLYRTTEEQQAPPTDEELAVIAAAKTLLGKAPNAGVLVNGKSFTLDCIGTVGAVFWSLSMDVTKDFDLYSGNGVNRLYMTLKERNALHTDKYPRPGDVIIWDNTWDADDDGDRVHDPRTHAGIVLAVDEDGTIHYVHENLYKGIVIEVMNLVRPTEARDEQGKLINSGLAIATETGGPKPAHSLSGDVFNCFGDVLGQKYYFYVDLAALDGSRGDSDVAAALQRGR
jgi:cell wall-associated NlpC family hydrolase